MTSRGGSQRLESLPSLLARKLYKTGQTRGASTREIYQNRVGRNSTVLIPYDYWDACKTPDDGTGCYENGYIVLVDPSWYLSRRNADAILAKDGLELGRNALLLVQRRRDWLKLATDTRHGWGAATKRLAPLGGNYLARVHSTTADNDKAISYGYNTKSMRGAGIRVYEYASTERLRTTRLQLEALVWLCHDSLDAVGAAGMTRDGARRRRRAVIEEAEQEGLLDYRRLLSARMIDDQHRTICPLCLELVSAADFMKRGEQAEGRETWDITITELSLFHIEELRVGKLQHKPYNLGWGHHFCNVVVKDAGIVPTLGWMKRVLDNNGDSWIAIEKARQSVEKAVDL